MKTTQRFLGIMKSPGDSAYAGTNPSTEFIVLDKDLKSENSPAGNTLVEEKIDPEYVENFEFLSGMDVIEKELIKSVTPDPHTGSINGWAALAVVQGVDITIEKLARNVDTVAIISGLILSVSIPLLLDPPDFVYDLNNGSVEKIGYFLFLIMSITAHFTCIVLSGNYIGAFNASARESDRLRLISRSGGIPGWIYAFFWIGNGGVTFTAVVVSFLSYGLILSIIAFFVLLFTGVSAFWIRQKKFYFNSHVVHGWKAEHWNEKFDLTLPLLKIKHRAERARKLRQYNKTN